MRPVVEAGDADPARVDLAAIAEDPEAARVPGPGAERADWADVVLFRSGIPVPQANGPRRVRLANEGLEERVEAIRAWFAARGRPSFTWTIGPHSTPADLEDRLLALGAVPDPVEPHAWVMSLEQEPPGAEGLWTIRREAGVDDVRARFELFAEAFGWSPDDAAATIAHAPDVWERLEAWPREWTYGAWQDGELLAVGGAIDLDAPAILLSGAATRASARGRGLYRALVRRRWDDAVALGKQGLVIEASDDARRVLEPLGFRVHGRVSFLRDGSDTRRRRSGAEAGRLLYPSGASSSRAYAGNRKR